MFKKIIFFIFIFSFIHIFIFPKNVEAEFIVDSTTLLVRNCVGTTTSAILYAVDSSNLIGTLPLCLRDLDVGQTLNIYKGPISQDNFVASTTSTGGDISYNYSATITASQFSSRRAIFNFLISDNAGGNQTTPSIFDLTLRPATITMTSNISGGNFRTTNGELNTVLGTPEANIPRNLKHRDTFNVSCTNTTDLWIESKSDTGSPTIPAANLGATITTSGNTKSISIRYDATTTNKTFQITCKNIGGHGGSGGNSVYTQFVTPKRFTVSYRNWTPTTTIPAKRV